MKQFLIVYLQIYCVFSNTSGFGFFEPDKQVTNYFGMTQKEVRQLKHIIETYSEGELLGNCRKSEEQSCILVGLKYFFEGKFEESELYLGKSCEQKSGLGCFFLAHVYEKTDFKKYFKLVKRSCDLDVEAGCDLYKIELKSKREVK